MTNLATSHPVSLPVCPATDEGARDTRALVHILIVVGVLWALVAIWRSTRRPPGRRAGPPVTPGTP